ncbi:hypothetical protein HO543_07525 [Streptococcus suis]|nr:hypothetical protein [Streptococcus suis]NQJ77163.1 hypothetical protein [Streptococcus suis]
MHNPVRFALRKLSVGLVSVAFLLVVTTICSVEVSADTEAVLGNSIHELSTLADIGDGKELSLDEQMVSQAETVTSLNQSDQPQLNQGLYENQNEAATPRLNGDSSATNQEDSLSSGEYRSSGEPTSPKENPVIPVSQPTSYYVTDSGETREIIWAQGVTPPSMGEAGDFKKEVTGEFVEYSMPFEAGKGYYDANKSLDASIEDLNLCFAAVSSNMLHWWLEQNQDYVARFISEKYGADLGQQDYSLTDIRRYTDSFENQQNSRIFNLFKAYYGRRLNGFVSDALVDLFINGYPPKSQGGVNLENPDLVPDKRGGFFHEVFKEKMLTDRMFSGDYLYFGNLVRNNLENQGLLGLTYRTFGTTTHIVTVWGAEYDENGLIRAVYITDSDDQHHPIGLKRMGITRDSSGNPRLNNNVVKNSVGSHLDYVHVIKLGQSYWEEYFNPMEEKRQLARQQLANVKEETLLAIRSQEEFLEKEKNDYSSLLEAKYGEVLASINAVVVASELATVLESGMKQLAIPMQKLGGAVQHSLPKGHLSVHGSSVSHELPVGHLSLHGSSVTHELPVGHVSVHGSSVTHELPVGHLSLHGSSVSHELPVGHLSLHGSSVSHELPVGHVSVHGSSVTHELPVGHLSLHGSSVTHELPVGHLSPHGSSVSHELPVGHLFLHGSSVMHELPVGHLSLHGSFVTHDLPVGHLFLHGSSVTHELPVGHLSLHGSSVTHELPVGHLSLHGSSVTHELPVGHLSLHGSSVSHELPVGHLSLHGSSVSHELPVGHLSLHGSSVTHELPVGHLSLHGSSVTQELPVGHLSLHGSSVTQELPVGHLSLHGSSVSHELPVGHLSLHGSSVTHELPVGALSSSEDLVADKLEHVTVENTEIDHTGREIVNQIISFSNEYSGKISIRPTLNMRENGYKNANFSSELIVEQETVGQDSSIGLPRAFNQSSEPDFQFEKDSEKEQVTPSTSISSNNQNLGKGSEKAVAKGDEADSQEKETADQTPYLIAFSLLGIGAVGYWLLFHKMIKVDKS